MNFMGIQLKINVIPIDEYYIFHYFTVGINDKYTYILYVCIIYVIMYDTSPPPNEFSPITTVYLEHCKRGKTLMCSDSCFSRYNNFQN